MRALLYAMHKEIAPPLDGGTPVENGAGLPLRRLPGDLMVCVCGVGKVNAALAAQYLIDHFAPEEIWNAGVSGCFTDLPAGTLVAAHCCVQHDFEIFDDPPGQVPVLDLVELPCAVSRARLEALSAAGFEAVTGVVATGDWFGRNYDRAARVRDQFNATVCDMEAAAAAQVCLRNGVVFHTLKVVSDHLFHPSQYEEYQANAPAVTATLNRALAVLMEV